MKFNNFKKCILTVSIFILFLLYVYIYNTCQYACIQLFKFYTRFTRSIKKVQNLRTFKKYAPSIVPVVPKLQHDPHTAWSLTGVTAPFKI